MLYLVKKKQQNLPTKNHTNRNYSEADYSRHTLQRKNEKEIGTIVETTWLLS